jgi:hypothetical protein
MYLFCNVAYLALLQQQGRPSIFTFARKGEFICRITSSQCNETKHPLKSPENS